jgi:aromatic ring-opening dioxygenase LigB subunit
MLTFASITPHPPLIIPTIGKPEDLKLVQNTVKAMEKLAGIFNNSEVETLILISPHGPLQFDQFTINKALSFEGHFKNFGDFETEIIFRNDLRLVQEIEKNLKEQKIPVRSVDLIELDHGSLVPLYYLSLPSSKKSSGEDKNKTPDFKLIHLAFSLLDFKTHFEVGKILKKAIDSYSLIRANKRIGIVASGDLSHRLLPDAPGGFSPEGKKFDKKLISLIEKKDVKGILNLDPDFVEAAGECGFRSILILLGALNGLNWKPEILSYEGPFGVGYLVVNFKLK